MGGQGPTGRAAHIKQPATRKGPASNHTSACAAQHRKNSWYQLPVPDQTWPDYEHRRPSQLGSKHTAHSHFSANDSTGSTRTPLHHVQPRHESNQGSEGVATQTAVLPAAHTAAKPANTAHIHPALDAEGPSLNRLTVLPHHPTSSPPFLLPWCNSTKRPRRAPSHHTTSHHGHAGCHSEPKEASPAAKPAEKAAAAISAEGLCCITAAAQDAEGRDGTGIPVGDIRLWAWQDSGPETVSGQCCQQACLGGSEGGG